LQREEGKDCRVVGESRVNGDRLGIERNPLATSAHHGHTMARLWHADGGFEHVSVSAKEKRCKKVRRGASHVLHGQNRRHRAIARRACIRAQQGSCGHSGVAANMLHVSRWPCEKCGLTRVCVESAVVRTMELQQWKRLAHRSLEEALALEANVLFIQEAAPLLLAIAGERFNEAKRAGGDARWEPKLFAQIEERQL
jgi:hypothetical protein